MLGGDGCRTPGKSLYRPLARGKVRLRLLIWLTILCHFFGVFRSAQHMAEFSFSPNRLCAQGKGAFLMPFPKFIVLLALLQRNFPCSNPTIHNETNPHLVGSMNHKSRLPSFFHERSRYWRNTTHLFDCVCCLLKTDEFDHPVWLILSNQWYLFSYVLWFLLRNLF